MNKKKLRVLIVIGMGILLAIGCRGGEYDESRQPENAALSGMDDAGGSMEEVSTDADMSSEISQSGTETESEEDEPGIESKKNAISKETPQLPVTGRKLDDFVPQGWEILDSVELDFNEDGISDYVGVLEVAAIEEEEYEMYPGYPRILFAIAGDETVGYRLDFQDINLIRTRKEGGIFGDPYMPLTAEKTSFTTHAFGGSAWKWSEEYTYIYCEGVWRISASEVTYGYQEYTTSYRKDDWERGVRIRKKRSDNFVDMEKSSNTEEFDVEYEMLLDEPPTLEQVGKRWWIALDRVTDWGGVEAIVIADDVELSEDKVRFPDEEHLYYCDEDCVLYTFSDTDSESYYLAMYRFQDRTLSVLVEETFEINDSYLELYKGKIYYTVEIEEDVTYKEMQDGKEQIIDGKDTVEIRLKRMNLDGTEKENVFEYRFPEADQEIMENRLPSLWLIYEISGNEIVAEVYTGNEPHPVYRMNTDGSGQKRIGQIPRGT